MASKQKATTGGKRADFDIATKLVLNPDPNGAYLSVVPAHNLNLAHNRNPFSVRD
jgi:hypothetical protein